MELFLKKPVVIVKKTFIVLALAVTVLLSAAPEAVSAKTGKTTSVKLALAVESAMVETKPVQTTANSTVSTVVKGGEVTLVGADGKSGKITNPTVEEVKAEIVRQAKEYGVSEKTALRIAFCESSYKFDAKNPRGSAKGVYQFIDGTWKYIGAKGHQFDYEENIRQFMIHYPKNPGWWECK